MQDGREPPSIVGFRRDKTSDSKVDESHCPFIFRERGKSMSRRALRNGFEQRCLFSVTLDVHFVSCKWQVTYEKFANKRLEKTAIANRGKIQGEKERERELIVRR